MTEILWHVMFVSVFFVLGVPLNVAVVWIYRRKGSSLRQNKFPLLFAAFDLFAGLIVLPLQPPRYLVSDVWVYEIHNGLSTFLMNGYLFTLFMATLDKFYAVMRPFKYRQKQKLIVNIAYLFAFGFNLVFIMITSPLRQITLFASLILMIRYVYTAVVLLTPPVTILFYVPIIAKLIANGKKLQKTVPKAAR